jgi:hypothetical protein
LRRWPFWPFAVCVPCACVVPEPVELVLVDVPWLAVLCVLVVPTLVEPCGAAPAAGGAPLQAMAAAGASAATAATAPVASAMRVRLNVI